MTENNLHEFPRDKQTNTRLAFAGLSILVIVIFMSLFLWLTREKQKFVGECRVGDTKTVDGKFYYCASQNWQLRRPVKEGTVTVIGSGQNTTQLATVNSGPMLQTNTVKVPEKDNSPSCMCSNDALTDAVLDRINETGFWDASYNDFAGRDSYHDMQLRLNQLRRYASNLTDTCLQASYLSWVAFYQKRHDEGLDKLLHPGKTAEEDDSDRKDAQEKKEAAECKRNGTVPRIRWK